MGGVGGGGWLAGWWCHVSLLAQLVSQCGDCRPVAPARLHAHAYVVIWLSAAKRNRSSISSSRFLAAEFVINTDTCGISGPNGRDGERKRGGGAGEGKEVIDSRWEQDR